MREPKYPDGAPRRSYADEVAASHARQAVKNPPPDWQALQQAVRNAMAAAKPRRGRPKGSTKAAHA